MNVYIIVQPKNPLYMIYIEEEMHMCIQCMMSGYYLFSVIILGSSQPNSYIYSTKCEIIHDPSLT